MKNFCMDKKRKNLMQDSKENVLRDIEDICSM